MYCRLITSTLYSVLRTPCSAVLRMLSAYILRTMMMSFGDSDVVTNGQTSLLPLLYCSRVLRLNVNVFIVHLCVDVTCKMLSREGEGRKGMRERERGRKGVGDFIN